MIVRTPATRQLRRWSQAIVAPHRSKVALKGELPNKIYGTIWTTQWVFEVWIWNDASATDELLMTTDGKASVAT